MEILIKAASAFELNNAFETFSEKFDQITIETPSEIKKINAALKKVGLLFKEKKIIINDYDRWEEVSMFCRTKKAHFFFPCP